MITKRSTLTYQGGAVLLFLVGPKNFKQSETKKSATCAPKKIQSAAKLKQRGPRLRKKIKMEKNVCYYIFSESLNAG